MKIENLRFKENNWEYKEESIEEKASVDLVLCFGDTDSFDDPKHYEYLHTLYPNAYIIGSSSSGNIAGPFISENPLVATAVSFDSVRLKLNVIEFTPQDDLAIVSKNLIKDFEDEALKSIFVISDGLNMNGTILAQTLHEEKPNTLITGGLAGDGARFERTLIMADSRPKEGQILALGFYGENVHVSSGCFAGWQEFGVERIITKSTGNVVYEINNEPALTLYKRYLGDEAKNLPGSGLRFPLSIRKDEHSDPIIRTVLAVDEQEQSLTFAGDVPEGYLAKLMKTDVDQLIDGSTSAANSIVQTNNNTALGLVVSCVGRKLVMKELTDEELETIEETIGENVKLTGFYSYGELAPFSSQTLDCKLHNQTMTLTVVYED